MSYIMTRERINFDEEAAKVVRHIFDLCMEGRGPLQIANSFGKSMF